MKKVRSSLNLDLNLSLPRLPAALLDGLFEHPAWGSSVVPQVQTIEVFACQHGFSATR
jgi:hypothetical protein